MGVRATFPESTGARSGTSASPQVNEAGRLEVKKGPRKPLGKVLNEESDERECQGIS